jgi:hypothetical protein
MFVSYIFIPKSIHARGATESRATTNRVVVVFTHQELLTRAAGRRGGHRRKKEKSLPRIYSPHFAAAPAPPAAARNRRSSSSTSQSSRYVAVQVKNLRKQTLKPSFHCIASRVETETRRFRATGQLDKKTCTAPPVPKHCQHHDVALQVAFERQTLKSGFHLIGYRLWV